MRQRDPGTFDLTVWNRFRIELPIDWELLRFTRNPETGSCGWADRRQFRAELSWRRVPGPPDFERMIGDYIARLQEEEKLEGDPKRRRLGAWRGFEVRSLGQQTARFGRFFESDKLLAEIVLFWPAGADATAQQRIVESIRREESREDNLVRWRSFGLDLRVPEGMALAGCSAMPAHAVMRFERSGGRQYYLFERRGMVSKWLDDGVETWLRKQVGAALVDPRESAAVLSGHTVHTVRGRVPRPPLRLWERVRQRHTAAWICPEDGRLYSVSLVGAAEAMMPTGAHLAGERLGCCRAMGISR